MLLLPLLLAASLVLPIPDGTIQLDVERTTRTANGDLVIRARPSGEEGWAVLAGSNGRWYGNVRAGTRSFEIRYEGVIETSGERTPPELPPAPPRRAPELRGVRAESVPPDAEGVVVDVLIFYTSRLRSLVPEEDIRNTANAAVEEANLAYERSGVSHRIRLVGLEETAYDESIAVPGNNEWDAARLRMVDPADGFMDEMHTRRDALHADAVILMIRRSDACGYANLMTAPASTSFAPEAFALVSIQCAARDLALAHELGHLMGLEHDRAGRVPGFEPAFPYAFGYRDPNDKFRTIMATEIACERRCPKVPYFSNPERMIDGQPLGIAPGDPQAANNALALEQTMPIVAQFRQAATPVVLVRSFAADPSQVEQGQSVTLTWDTEGASSVAISGLGPVAAQGSVTVTPSQSTTYTLIASQPGATITAFVHVVVNCGGTPCEAGKRRAVRK